MGGESCLRPETGCSEVADHAVPRTVGASGLPVLVFFATALYSFMFDRYCSRLVVALLFAGLLAVFDAGPAAAQTAYTISGQVFDASNEEALPGANVRIVGTSFGTATAADGQFSFTARLDPGTYQVRVSFVGYEAVTRQIELADRQDVSLDPFRLDVAAGRFEELVVTGQAGPTRRRELGNAISSVESADLQEAPNTSTLQALQGQIAGARISQNSGNPAGGTSIRLRGTGTVLGDADPLIVVDGVIVSNDSPELIQLGGTSQNRLVDINPNDIERIEVVKGAAAAALYGSRANNGVVQIFTKEGQEGETDVTYRTRFETSSIRRKIDVNMAKNDQGQFLDNSGNPLPEGQRRFDFQDFIFDRAFSTEQYLSVSGAEGDTRFFTSGAYSFNQGIIDETKFERYNGTARLQHTITEWANVSVGARYSFSESADIPNGGLNSNFGALTGFIFGPNTFDPRRNDDGEFPNQGILANPLEVQARYDFGQETSRFIGDLQFDLTPMDGLSINYILGLDTFEQIGTTFIPRGTSAPGLSTGQSRRSEFSNLQLNSDLNIRYETSVLPNLSSTTLIGGSFQYESEETFSASSQNLAPVAEVVGSGTDSRNFGESREPLTLYGAFGQQKFGWADRLFVTGALRFDASSSFGEGDRWQAYPKASASLVASEFDVWQDALGPVLPSFKLRGSVGWSGGLTSIGAFDRFTNFNPQSFVGKPGLQPSTQLGAIGVQPERQREIEVGADFSILSDRLSVEFTYYQQETEDLLLTQEVAPTSGFDTRLSNIGIVENDGVELRARGVPLAQEEFQWISTFTYTRNRNEVSEIPSSGGEVGRVVLPSSFGVSVAQNGRPIGSFFGSAFERDDNGQVLDTEGNVMKEDDDGFFRPVNCEVGESGCSGIPAQASEDKIIGEPQPDFTFSWINQVQVGNNLSFRFQFDGEVGQDVFNFTRRLGSLSFFGTTEDFERELEGDLPSGYNAATFNIFENWVESGTFVKLREVAVNYTIQTSRLPFESVKINASGRNLVSFDSYDGFDPETNVGGQRTGVRGFDFVQVPIPRSFSLGATLNF